MKDTEQNIQQKLFLLIFFFGPFTFVSPPHRLCVKSETLTSSQRTKGEHVKLLTPLSAPGKENQGASSQEHS